MEKLIEGAKLIKEVISKDDRVIDLRFIRQHLLKNRIVASAQVMHWDFKDLVEENDILPHNVVVTNDKSDHYPIKLEVNIDGVYFFTIMDEERYEAEFKEWHTEEPNIDEEFIVDESPLTENERLMKEAGHKLSDFM